MFYELLVIACFYILLLYSCFADIVLLSHLFFTVLEYGDDYDFS
jgi:hypothetical protein